MEKFAKILTVKEKEFGVYGQVVAIYFEDRNRDGAILELTFINEGKMCRHDVDFENKEEGRHVFSILNNENFYLVDKKVLIASEIENKKGETIQ